MDDEDDPKEAKTIVERDRSLANYDLAIQALESSRAEANHLREKLRCAEHYIGALKEEIRILKAETKK